MMHSQPVDEVWQQNQLRKWLLWAVLASLLLHLVLYVWFRGLPVGFGSPLVDPIEPRRFNLERATIDPASLEPEIQPLQNPRPQSLQSSAEAPNPGEIEAFAGPLQAPRIPMPTIHEGPTSPLSAGPAPVPVEAFSAMPVEAQGKLPSPSQALVDEASTAALEGTQKALGQSNLAGGDDAAAIGRGVPGFDDISALVNLKAPDALERPAFQPILVRLSNDVLFAFDSANLLPGSEVELDRLAQALRGAMQVKITVEGHTDSIGDDAYNMALSQKRAQTVADWLQAHSSLGAAAFSVRGYGKTRPIVPQTGNAEQESRNRRVEIRIEAEK